MRELQNPKPGIGNRFDVIIIGGGPAGLSAAMWCADLGLTSVVLEAGNEFGGQLLRTYNRIDNHLGMRASDGREMIGIFVEQTAERNFTRRFGARVAAVDPRGKKIFLEDGEEYTGHALIFATGVKRRTLGIAGEIEFSGRGIIESGKRDQNLAADRDVLIVGGGDAALENVLILAETARKVVLVHRRSVFRAREEFTEKLESLSNFEFIPESIPVEIIGESKVEAIEIENTRTGDRRKINAGVVLIRIGVEPVSDFLDGKLETDERGYICIDSISETSEPGVFAVGDVANPMAPTVSSAVGMAATAVKAIALRLTKSSGC